MALNQTTGICDYERMQSLPEADSLRFSVHIEGEMCNAHQHMAGQKCISSRR